MRLFGVAWDWDRIVHVGRLLVGFGVVRAFCVLDVLERHRYYHDLLVIE